MLIEIVFLNNNAKISKTTSSGILGSMPSIIVKIYNGSETDYRWGWWSCGKRRFNVVNLFNKDSQSLVAYYSLMQVALIIVAQSQALFLIIYQQMPLIFENIFSRVVRSSGQWHYHRVYHLFHRIVIDQYSNPDNCPGNRTLCVLWLLCLTTYWSFGKYYWNPSGRIRWMFFFNNCHDQIIYCTIRWTCSG